MKETEVMPQLMHKQYRKIDFEVKMNNNRKEWQKNNDLFTSENENYESINSLTTNALNLAQKNGNNEFSGFN